MVSNCRFFYGMLLAHPRWESGHEPPIPADHPNARLYYAFALPFLEWFEHMHSYLAKPFVEWFEPDGEWFTKLEWEYPFYQVDGRWEERDDPLTILDIYTNEDCPPPPILAVRETLHREESFDLPAPLDRAAWDQLLRAKCEAHHLVFEAFAPPRFYIFRSAR